MSKYYVTVYNTTKSDIEIDRYLTTKMKAKSVNDICPTKQFECLNWDEATFLYEKLCKYNNVVAKFNGNKLLIATNRNLIILN